MSKNNFIFSCIFLHLTLCSAPETTSIIDALSALYHLIPWNINGKNETVRSQIISLRQIPNNASAEEIKRRITQLERCKQQLNPSLFYRIVRMPDTTQPFWLIPTPLSLAFDDATQSMQQYIEESQAPNHFTLPAIGGTQSIQKNN